jgi:hypothetical protein
MPKVAQQVLTLSMMTRLALAIDPVARNDKGALKTCLLVVEEPLAAGALP